MTSVSTKQSDEMSTYWLEFSNYEAAPDERFLGVAILDGDAGSSTIAEVVEEASRLGINPGGEVMADELPVDAIPDSYKKQLITDKELVIQLEKIAGVYGRNRLMEKQYDAILTHFGDWAAERANYGWGGGDDSDEYVSLVTKIYTTPRHVIVSESYAPFAEFTHTLKLYEEKAFLSEPLNGAPVPFADITSSRLSKYGIHDYTGPAIEDQAHILISDAGWVRVHKLDDGRVEFETPDRRLPDPPHANPCDAILKAIATEFGIEIVREGDDRFRCWMPDRERQLDWMHREITQLTDLVRCWMPDRERQLDRLHTEITRLTDLANPTGQSIPH